MIYSFADCELDCNRRELRRSGCTVHVEPQVFDLLEMLLLNRNRLVSKDQLFDQVWQGRIVSETTLSSRVSAARRAIGDSGDSQRLIVTLPRRGFRFSGDVKESLGSGEVGGEQAEPVRSNGLDQTISFRTTPDGIRLAVAVLGEGHALVKTSNWMNHVAHDLDNPLWSPLFQRLARSRQLVRYDGRGVGLSDWNVEDISFEKFVLDLETVIDGLNVEKVSLLGMSMGAATAIAYAARNPKRVHKIILHGGFAIGRRRRNSAADLERADLFLSLMRQGWGKPDAAFLKAFSCIYFPHAQEQQLQWFTELQQRNASPDNAVRIRAACDEIDVAELLPSISAPTLVMHNQDDQVVPIEQGRLIASSMPNARFLPLKSSNHMILPDEPEGPRAIAAMHDFLGAGPR